MMHGNHLPINFRNLLLSSLESLLLFVYFFENRLVELDERSEFICGVVSVTVIVQLLSKSGAPKSSESGTINPLL